MNTENASSITKRKIGSRKGIVLVCAALAFAGDLAVMLAFAINGFGFLSYLFPLIMAVIDAAFFALALLSNFRFRYTIAESIAYVLFTLGCTVACLLMNDGISFSSDSGVSMTYYAVILWSAVHLLVCAGVVASSLFAVKFRKSRSIILFIISLLLAACLAFSCLAYISYVYTEGFFGQGSMSSLRTLVYTYDEDSDTYTVSDIIDGKSDTVEIPEEFNGKKVSAVNCSVFAASGVTTARFCSEVELENVRAFARASSSLTIYADKEYADTYRQELYKAASTYSSDKILNLANTLTPEGLGEYEVYVAFTVTAEMYDMLEGNVPGIYYGTEGEKVSLTSYYSQYPWMEHTDLTSDADLCWAYNSNDGYILSVPLGNDVTVDGTRVIESSTVEMSFVQVYRVSFGADNDSKYTLSESYTQTALDGDTYNYKYTVLANAENLINKISRAGFSLTWYYTAYGSTEREEFTSLASAIAEGGDDIKLYPEWELNAPGLKLTADNTSVVYGDSVLLTASATHAAEDIEYSYSWVSADGTTATGDSTYALDIPVPSQSGTYTVSVTASAGSTSLTSYSTEQIEITIAKKQLTVTWTLPESLVYSGTAKTVACALDSAEFVNGDSVALSYTSWEITDAGSYDFAVSVDSASQEKYTLGNDSTACTISPYSLAVTWSGIELTYNGNAQAPEASATGVGSDGAQTITVSGEQTNAGTYTAEASIANANYTISNSTQQFTINPYSLTVDWGNTSLTYNGYEQKPTATATGVGSDGAQTITVSGEQKDANTTEEPAYMATASISNTNYTISNASRSFTIAQYSLTVTWNDTYLTYNGTERMPKATATGAGIDGTITLTVTLDREAINAGTYTATATTNNRNYTVGSEVTHEFTVGPREVSAKWGDTTTFTYDGETHAPTASATGLNDITLPVTVSGGQTDAGEHTATATTSNSNYTLIDNTCDFVIEAKPITVTWSNTSLTYSGYAQTLTATAKGVGDVELTITVSGEGTNVNTTENPTYTAEASIADTNYTISNNTQTFTISPYSLEVTWSNTSLTYSGYAQTLTATATGVDGKALTITVSGEGTNVNTAENPTYTAEASIADTNYTISNNTQTFTISPYSLTVEWSNTSLTYSGYEQAPTASATGLGGDGPLTITVSGGQTNANTTESPTYTASASINNGNYTISNDTQSFTISPWGLAISWSNTSLTYSGKEQTPTATALGVGDDGYLDEYITVSGAQKNANPIDVSSYTATASIINSNYTITYYETCSYVINRAEATVVWGEKTTFTYDGTAHAPTATINGVGDDGVVELYVPNTPTYAGSYTATAYCYSSNDNYALTNDTCTFVINQAEIEVTWSGISLTYNGSVQTPTATAIGVGNVELTLTVTVEDGEGINAGTYTATAALTDSTDIRNYTIINSTETTTFTISAYSLEVEWSGTSFTYDGSEHAPTIATVTGLGDDGELTITVTVDGGTAIEEGEYKAKASIDNDNYTISNSEINFTIAAAE